MKQIIFSIAFLFLLLWLSSSVANPNDLEPFDYSAAQQDLVKISQTDLQNTSLDQLDALILQAETYVDYGKQCASMAQQELEQTDKAFIALGEKVTGEPKDITSERSGLQVLKNQAEVRGAQCRLLTIKAANLVQKLEKTKKQIFTRNLLARGPGILELIQKSKISSTQWLQTITVFFWSGSGIGSLSPYHLTLIILSAGAGFFLGKKVHSIFAGYAGKMEQTSFAFALLRTTSQGRKSFLLAGVLLGVALSVHLCMLDVFPQPYLPAAVFSLLISLFVLLFTKSYFRLLITENHVDKPATGMLRLYLMALLSGILSFVFTSSLSQSLPETVFYLIRALSITFWYATLLWSFWFVCNVSWIQAWRRNLRLFLVFLMGSVTFAELNGYRVLASHILAGTSGTLILVFLLLFCKYLIEEIIGGFGKGRYIWQQNIRQKAGIEKTHVITGIIWTNSLLKLVLFTIFTYLFLRLWGLSEVYSSAFYDWLVEGFTIGSIAIIPSRVGVGFLIFALGWSTVSLIKDKFIRQWMTESELAASVQDALSTVLGYLGYSITILVALSTAGINFSGLAMVAGALSVGIGFGLQNIVNNLVSGLILLFERPIKRGDWIIVGSTEGYVKKISVRSTIIQTFDRSDVIVPNSELISSQVVNMMLLDTRGRLRVAVGVAYGSDTALVKEILLEIARKHPEVITNGTAPDPVVRFQAFGESSLDFELFCHLKDVDKRIDVKSDMNFAIDKAFRNHHIEIPFAQRDIHIRNTLEGTVSKGPAGEEPSPSSSTA